MRPKKHEMTGAGDLFRARLDQIINLKHELVQLAGKIDWAWIDGEIAPLFSDKGRPATSDPLRDRAASAQAHLTPYQMNRCASAGSTTPISSTSPGRSSSNMSSRTSALT